MILDWFRDHASQFTGSLHFDEPLARHTYYRIGGPAALIAVPKSVDDLRWLYRGIQATSVPHFILGAGSNLLASDQGYAGLAIKMTRLDLSVEMSSPGMIRTGASVAISSLLRRAGTEGWKGFELWTGIPGSIGGAVAMNAGTHLGEARDIAHTVEAFSFKTGELLRFEGSELKFEYRKNLFLPEDTVVVGASWRVTLDEPSKVQAIISETLARRKASQPIDYPSCGSVFKNPKSHGLHAWQVIERIGLRGHRIGDAEFSSKHCNFIVNLDAATSADVKALIDLAKARAREQLGIELEEEVKYL